MSEHLAVKIMKAMFRPLPVTFRSGPVECTWEWQDVPPLDRAELIISRLREAIATSEGSDA